jgi:hypothetical protein
MTLFIHVVANLFLEILLFLIQEALIERLLITFMNQNVPPPQKKKTIKKISLRTKPSTQPSHEVVVEDP